jgi:hypothetical protein
MFLQDTIDYINTLNSDNKSTHVELEIKFLLDQRIKKPYFIRSQLCENNVSVVKSNVVQIIRNALQYGTSTLSQTINFINTKTNSNGMFV